MTAAGPCHTIRPALPSTAGERRFPRPRACHGSGSPSGQQAWLCPPDRGRSLSRSPLPGSWALCQPHCWQGAAAGGLGLGLPGTILCAAARGWQGSAHPTWAQRVLCPGSSRGTGRGRAVPAASGGGPPEAGGMPCSGAEPRAEQGPSFAVPGDSSEPLCERTQWWSRSQQHQGVAQKANIVRHCANRACALPSALPGLGPCAQRLNPQAGFGQHLAGCRGAGGSSSKTGCPGSHLPGNLICWQSWSEGPMVRKPPQTAGSAHRPSVR